ncbi:MAG: SRPBCC family protein, partial [Fimbriimonadales bacterium]|nr:SRPBCC family protein [Fimbriimonadales bacterium]
MIKGFEGREAFPADAYSVYLLLEEKLMPRIEKSVSVNAPAEKVFEVLQQADSFAQFLPHARTVQVLERTESSVLLDWEVIAPGVGMPVR